MGSLNSCPKVEKRRSSVLGSEGSGRVAILAAVYMNPKPWAWGGVMERTNLVPKLCLAIEEE